MKNNVENEERPFDVDGVHFESESEYLVEKYLFIKRLQALSEAKNLEEKQPLRIIRGELFQHVWRIAAGIIFIFGAVWLCSNIEPTERVPIVENQNKSSGRVAMTNDKKSRQMNNFNNKINTMKTKEIASRIEKISKLSINIEKKHPPILVFGIDDAGEKVITNLALKLKETSTLSEIDYKPSDNFFVKKKKDSVSFLVKLTKDLELNSLEREQCSNLNKGNNIDKVYIGSMPISKSISANFSNNKNSFIRLGSSNLSNYNIRAGLPHIFESGVSEYNKISTIGSNNTLIGVSGYENINITGSTNTFIGRVAGYDKINDAFVLHFSGHGTLKNDYTSVKAKSYWLDSKTYVRNINSCALELVPKVSEKQSIIESYVPLTGDVIIWTDKERIESISYQVKKDSISGKQIIVYGKTISDTDKEKFERVFNKYGGPPLGRFYIANEPIKYSLAVKDKYW